METVYRDSQLCRRFTILSQYSERRVSGSSEESRAYLRISETRKHAQIRIGLFCASETVEVWEKAWTVWRVVYRTLIQQ